MHSDFEQIQTKITQSFSNQTTADRTKQRQEILELTKAHSTKHPQGKEKGCKTKQNSSRNVTKMTTNMQILHLGAHKLSRSTWFVVCAGAGSNSGLWLEAGRVDLWAQVGILLLTALTTAQGLACTRQWRVSATTTCAGLHHIRAKSSGDGCVEIQRLQRALAVRRLAHQVSAV